MKKNYKPVVAVCILILFVAAAGAVYYAVNRYLPTREQMDLNEYYGQTQDDEAALIIGTQIVEQKGRIAGEKKYIPLSVVNTFINQRYYWDSEGQRVLYATPSQLTSVPADTEAGGDVWKTEDTVYLSTDYIGQYTDIEVSTAQEPNRIAVQYDFTDVKVVKAKKNTAVRYRGGIKSPVLTKVKKGTALRLLEELENWSQVATEDGYIGYVQKKHIDKPEQKEYKREFQAEPYTYITMDGPVNLAWHQVTTMEANAYLGEAIANMTGVNVISPTWFSVADNSGNITSIASADYVAQAHERGLKVWGLIDNFSTEISTTTVLSSTSARQNLIKQLVQAALDVGLDGINIDFEYLSEDVGIHFLQFLRELSAECHNNHLVLSVDNPVPEVFTSHYDRAEQGRVVDYVIIMGYDEHYVGSEAGSVASLPWVEKGVQDTLKEVPAERVINAIPFYTRLWKTTGGALTSEAIGMDLAQESIAKYQMAPYWDNSVGQNYGTSEYEGATYQIWVEDAQSIAEKVKLVPKYGLAGVASWKLGFENSGIWQVITDNLQ